MDFTDIHHLRAADWNVNAARGNKYFGNCIVRGSDCQIPATAETANDTAASVNTFLPPAVVRGDIARALFYMHARYSASNNNGYDLRLTDCPLDDTSMAFLSELLQWHLDDPVSDKEMIRNNRACERWQGNRNPFVDKPDLAQDLFGEPRPFPYVCDVPSDTPGVPSEMPGEMPSIVPDAVVCVRPGAVMVIGINSDDPDSVALLAMEGLPGNTVLFLTDNAWTKEGSFRDNEGIISLRLPSSGIAAGTVFGYGEIEFQEWQWQNVEGNLQLSTAGDALFLYCRNSSDELTHIAALSFGGDWTDEEGGTTSSALPETLVDFAVSLKHADNYHYKGPSTGSVDFVRAAIVDSSNWESRNDQGFMDMGSVTFTLTAGSSGVNGAGTLSSSEVVAIGLPRGFLSTVTTVSAALWGIL
jgi:hypothetical protein